MPNKNLLAHSLKYFTARFEEPCLFASQKRKFKGFTLVELLVVVSIIAILSVIGIVIFTNTQKSAREARKKADIDSIFKAYEAKYDGVNGKYKVLSTSDFTSGKIPDNNGTSYNFVAGPDSISIPTEGGFKICTPLGDSTDSCSDTSDSCYCKKSVIGNVDAAIAGTPVGKVCGVSAQGLLTHWKFDEGSGNVVSNSGSAGSSKNGAWQGPDPRHWATPAEARIGKSAGKFSGAGDGTRDGNYVSFTSWPGITQPSSTISFWIYPTEAGRIIGGQQQYGDSLFMFDYSGEDVMFVVPALGGDGDIFRVSKRVPVNEWSLVAGTFNGTTIKLYVGTTAIFSSPTGGPFIPHGGTGEPFVMGEANLAHEQPQWINYFGGRLDDVRVYNRVLSDPEVGILFSGCPI